MSRVVVTLTDAERDGLVASAELERRDPRAQASVIIHNWLVEQGMLDSYIIPNVLQFEALYAQKKDLPD